MAVVAPQWKKVIFPAAVVAVLCVEGFQSPLHVRRCHYQQEDSRRGEGRVTALLAHGREDEIRLAGRVDRRRALASTAAAFLSLCLGIGGDKGGSALPAWAVGSDQGQDQLTATAASKTILITGCNSGIGFEAARILARQGNTIIMACRTLEKAVEAAERIRAETNTASLIPAECNLASLDSIRTFAKDLKADNLDVACYNAGLSLNQYDAEAQRTDDGFELTVGTNHLGHFYLNHLLLPKIKPTSRIVITASGVHDPNSPGGAQGKTATLGSLEGFIRDGMNFEMVDGGVFNADKAYKGQLFCVEMVCCAVSYTLAY